MITRLTIKARKEKVPQLPQEVVFWEILPKLPAISLIRLRSVSKEWLDFITNDKELKKTHHNQSSNNNSAEISAIVLGNDVDSFDPKLFFLSAQRQANMRSPKVKEFDMSYLVRKLESPKPRRIDLIGSSNGLVLLSDLILWNPATREFRILPQPVIKDNFIDRRFYCIYNIAFVDDDHKVLKVSQSWETDVNYDNVEWSLIFEVYSKRSDSWREIQCVPDLGIYRFAQKGILMDGVFYFIAQEENYHDVPRFVVLSYTYKDEVLRTVMNAHTSYPICPEFMRWKENSLAIVDQNITNPNLYDFWVMIKNHDDGLCNWSKLFVFNGESLCGAWSDRFIFRKSYYKANDKLVLLDPQSTGEEQYGSLVLVKLQDLIWDSFDAVDYVPTLVSVFPDLLEGENK